MADTQEKAKVADAKLFENRTLLTLGSAMKEHKRIRNFVMQHNLMSVHENSLQKRNDKLVAVIGLRESSSSWKQDQEILQREYGQYSDVIVSVDPPEKCFHGVVRYDYYGSKETANATTRMPACKNDPSTYYKEGTPSPKGLGYCAHGFQEGQVMQGFDGNMWIIKADKNGTKSWKKPSSKSSSSSLMQQGYSNYYPSNSNASQQWY